MLSRSTQAQWDTNLPTTSVPMNPHFRMKFSINWKNSFMQNSPTRAAPHKHKQSGTRSNQRQRLVKGSFWAGISSWWWCHCPWMSTKRENGNKFEFLYLQINLESIIICFNLSDHSGKEIIFHSINDARFGVHAEPKLVWLPFANLLPGSFDSW